MLQKRKLQLVAMVALVLVAVVLFYFLSSSKPKANATVTSTATVKPAPQSSQAANTPPPQTAYQQLLNSIEQGDFDKTATLRGQVRFTPNPDVYQTTSPVLKPAKVALVDENKTVAAKIAPPKAKNPLASTIDTQKAEPPQQASNIEHLDTPLSEQDAREITADTNAKDQTALVKELRSTVNSNADKPVINVEQAPTVSKIKTVSHNTEHKYLPSLSQAELQTLQKNTAIAKGVSVNFTPHKLAPDMVVIPAGRFKMGDIQNLGDFDEKPLREIKIIKPFAISSTEITYALWQHCLDAGECSAAQHDSKGGDQGWGKDTRPVINISWDAIVYDYIPWLNTATGLNFRLPTEAEWEYAARAGTESAYFWGIDNSRDYANFGKNQCCGPKADGADQWLYTAPVASFKPNAFGLYDMLGNVYEWVYDCYSENYKANTVDENCPSNKRVVRGGSWYDEAKYLRAANRSRYSSNFQIIYLGFRLVQDL